MPSKKKKGRHLPKVLDREQVKKILAQPNINCRTGMRNRVILQTLWRCGLRVSEACNLMVPNVDLENGFLFIQHAKNDSDRTVPLDEEVTKWLLRWKEIRPESDYFFCTLKGGQLDTRYIREVVYRAAEKAGVYLQDGEARGLVHPHTLRVCYATELLEEGDFNIREVQQLLGHSKVETTTVYTQIRPKALAAKIRKRSCS